MKRDVAKAELNTTDTLAAKSSWPVSTTEILDTKRTNRSSKPEVLYHLSPSRTSRSHSETWESRIQPSIQITSFRHPSPARQPSPSPVSQPSLVRQPSPQPTVSHTPPTDEAVGFLPRNTDDQRPLAQQRDNPPPPQPAVSQAPPLIVPPLIDGAAVALPDTVDNDVFVDPPVEDEMAEERHVTPQPLRVNLKKMAMRGFVIS